MRVGLPLALLASVGVQACAPVEPVAFVREPLPTATPSLRSAKVQPEGPPTRVEIVLTAGAEAQALEARYQEVLTQLTELEAASSAEPPTQEQREQALRLAEQVKALDDAAKSLREQARRLQALSTP